MYDRTRQWVEDHQEKDMWSTSAHKAHVASYQLQAGHIRYTVCLLGLWILNLKWLPASENWAVSSFKINRPPRKSYTDTVAFKWKRTESTEPDFRYTELLPTSRIRIRVVPESSIRCSNGPAPHSRGAQSKRTTSGRLAGDSLDKEFLFLSSCE